MLLMRSRRYFLLAFLCLCILQFSAFAQAADEQKSLTSSIEKVQKEIVRLETKLKKTAASARRAQIQEVIDGHKARLKKLKSQLEELSQPASLEAAATPEAYEVVSPEVIPYVPEEITEEEIPQEAAEAPAPKRFEFEIGAFGGLFAAATGAMGEVRFAAPYVLGPATSALRLSGGLMQSEDTERRYAAVCADGILNFPPGGFSSVDHYLGAGLNYVVLTTGRREGTIGGEVFYGVQGVGFGGTLFGEVGWGVLRTGFTPSHKGTTVLFGYRRQWAL